MSETVLLNITIDKDKRITLKTIAAQKGTTVTAILNELIDKYIEENS